MTLKDTVDMMLSDDYKERLKAEYYQLAIRQARLELRLKELYQLDLDSPIRNTMIPLCEQQYGMSVYMSALRTRMKEAGIDVEEL